MAVTNNLTQSIRDCYKNTNTWIRFYVSFRWGSVPFQHLLDQLPAGAHVLDIGCGHGIFCNAIAIHDPHAQVWGVDIDQRKIHIGMNNRQSDRVKIGHIKQLAIPDQLDAIILSDVYHHLAPEESQRILELAKQKLKRKTGIFLLKDMDKKPLWKFLYCYLFDILTGFFHITEGTSLNYKSIDEFVALLTQHGFRIIDIKSLDNKDMVPHILISCVVD